MGSGHGGGLSFPSALARSGGGRCLGKLWGWEGWPWGQRVAWGGAEASRGAPGLILPHPGSLPASWRFPLRPWSDALSRWQPGSGLRLTCLCLE